MRIGIPKEAQAGETRVAATPNTVEQMVKLGYEVVVEPGAGGLSSFTDAAYEAAGATLGDPFEAEIVFAVNAPPRRAARPAEAPRDLDQLALADARSATRG